MISRTAEYALRATVFLAERAPARLTTVQIAEATQVPPGYLAKVMQSLARARIVDGQRGVNGGFALSRPPQEISVWAVVQAVDPPQRIERCPLDIKEHTELCPLHRRLDDAVAMIEQSFQSTTLADLLESATFGPGPAAAELP